MSSSVFLAVLFRRAVRDRFDGLKEKFRLGRFLPDAHEERCEAAKTIVEAFVQASVRVNPQSGMLSSLIVSPQNHRWWVAAAADIKSSWRRIDAVFIIQIKIAALAWLLAIIADFWSIPGSRSSSTSAEWQICMGTLWLWVVSPGLP